MEHPHKCNLCLWVNLQAPSVWTNLLDWWTKNTKSNLKEARTRIVNGHAQPLCDIGGKLLPSWLSFSRHYYVYYETINGCIKHILINIYTYIGFSRALSSLTSPCTRVTSRRNAVALSLPRHNSTANWSVTNVASQLISLSASEHRNHSHILVGRCAYRNFATFLNVRTLCGEWSRPVPTNKADFVRI